MKHVKLTDTASAEAAGFRPLTISYQLPQERPLLDNVLADLRRGNINHCLVQSNGGVSVWRSFRSGTSGACTRSFRTGTVKKPGSMKFKNLRKSAATKTGRRSAASLPKKGKRS